MTFKIAICGAPGSGKTTFAARLYANLLENGISSTKLITEYAQDHLGQGLPIETLNDQIAVTKQQSNREKYASTCSYSPLICDSPVWIGAVYAENCPKMVEDTNFSDYYNNTIETVNDYDLTVFVPLFDTENSKLNKHRIHNVEQSKVVQDIIAIVTRNVKHRYTVSSFLEFRNSDIEQVTHIIKKSLT